MQGIHVFLVLELYWWTADLVDELNFTCVIVTSVHVFVCVLTSQSFNWHVNFSWAVVYLVTWLILLFHSFLSQPESTVLSFVICWLILELKICFQCEIWGIWFSLLLLGYPIRCFWSLFEVFWSCLCFAICWRVFHWLSY